MNRKFFMVLAAMLAIVFALSFNAAAQVPNTIMYQGRLTDAAGAPISAVTSVVFSIYATIGAVSPAWTETIANVTPDAQGVFTVELGLSTVLPANLFDGTKKYLGIKVGADTEMNPRQVLTSGPYSLNANIGDGTVTTAKIANGAVLDTKLGTGSVIESKIANYAVTTLKILDGAVTSGKIADGAINSAKIADLSIGTIDIADNAVSGAKVADGSLSSRDIIDEPGIARNYVTGSITIATTGVTNVLSSSMNVPAAGYIIARANANCGLRGTILGGVMASIEMNNTSVNSNEAAYFGYSDVTVFPGASDFTWGGINCEQIFAVGGAGTYTYYLNAQRSYTSGSAWFFYIKLELIYFPTRYGAITAAPVPATGSVPASPAEGIAPVGGIQENR